MSTEIKKIINEVTENIFKVIKQVYEYQKESSQNESKTCLEVGSRIIFPKYSDLRQSKEKNRISEQELRFIFVEQLNQTENGLFYSIETPTENFYDFSKPSNPEVINNEEHKGRIDHNKRNPTNKICPGRSANIDLVIYQKKDDKFNRVALIEFKALNPAETNYQKDFFKLENEKCNLKYFIQIIKNSNAGTIDNIKGKIANKKSDIIFICYCLDRGEKILDSRK